MHTYRRKLPAASPCDVIVLGSGATGSTAAIAAARSGAKPPLLDRLPFLGGTSTAVLDTFYGFYTPGVASKKVVGGISDEVMDGLQSYDSWLERPNTHGAKRSNTCASSATRSRVTRTPNSRPSEPRSASGKPGAFSANTASRATRFLRPGSSTTRSPRVEPRLKTTMKAPIRPGLTSRRVSVAGFPSAP